MERTTGELVVVVAAVTAVTRLVAAAIGEVLAVAAACEFPALGGNAEEAISRKDEASRQGRQDRVSRIRSQGCKDGDERIGKRKS